MAVAAKTRTRTRTRTKTAAETPAKTTRRARKETVNIHLIARNMKFSESNITVPAGAKVKMVFENQDYHVPHNFALYEDSTAAKSIFVGQIISGPATVDYSFTAPAEAGDYFFRCDVHPVIMRGIFRVMWPAK